jgi:hypothetical protein
MAPDRTDAVLRVAKGRGFIVDADQKRYVITAAHCLPKMPPAHAASFPEERTYKRLLGPLGRRPTVWTTCVFADPVADIAVLGGPDGQILTEECDAYVALTDPVVPFTIGALKFVQQQQRLPGGQVIRGLQEAEARGQILSLDRRWFACQVNSHGVSAWVEKPESPIEGGMSGSPILGPDSAAIAVVSVSDQHGEGGPHPLLNDALPGWFLRAKFSTSAN